MLVLVLQGFLRDSDGLVNLFSEAARDSSAGEGLLTAEDFAVYGRVIRWLKALVSDTFQYQGLHFTAPTFITRLDGDSDWSPRGGRERGVGTDRL